MRRARWKESYVMAEWCSHVLVATGPALLGKASPHSQLQICPSGIPTHCHLQPPRLNSMPPPPWPVSTASHWQWSKCQEAHLALQIDVSELEGLKIKREVEGIMYLLLPSLMASPLLDNWIYLIFILITTLRSVITTSGETEVTLRFVFLQSLHSFCFLHVPLQRNEGKHSSTHAKSLHKRKSFKTNMLVFCLAWVSVSPDEQYFLIWCD